MKSAWTTVAPRRGPRGSRTTEVARMLVRYDPFRDFDRFTEQVFGGPQRRQWMPMDAFRHGDDVELRFDLPGADADSIDVTVERNVLTVKAERSWTPAQANDGLARER